MFLTKLIQLVRVRYLTKMTRKFLDRRYLTYLNPVESTLRLDSLVFFEIVPSDYLRLLYKFKSHTKSSTNSSHIKSSTMESFLTRAKCNLGKRLSFRCPSGLWIRASMKMRRHGFCSPILVRETYRESIHRGKSGDRFNYCVLFHRFPATLSNVSHWDSCQP